MGRRADFLHPGRKTEFTRVDLGKWCKGRVNDRLDLGGHGTLGRSVAKNRRGNAHSGTKDETARSVILQPVVAYVGWHTGIAHSEMFSPEIC